MMQKIFLFLVISFAIPGLCQARDKIPSIVKPPVNTVFKNTCNDPVFGDLTADGVDDFAVCLWASDWGTPGEDNGQAILVYKGNPDGTYEIVARGPFFYVPGTMSLAIKKGSLYIEDDFNPPAFRVESVYQFKYRNDGFYLIGEEVMEYVAGEEGYDLAVRTSTNYLSGKKIEKQFGRKKGKEKVSILSEQDKKLVNLKEFEL